MVVVEAVETLDVQADAGAVCCQIVQVRGVSASEGCEGWDIPCLLGKRLEHVRNHLARQLADLLPLLLMIAVHVCKWWP